MEVRAGDVIEVPGNKVQQPARRGVVQRVLHERPLRIEVDWDDGHGSVFQPTGGTLKVVRRPRRRRTT